MQGYSPDRMQGDAAAAATANRPGLSLHSHQPEGDQDANIYRLTGEPSCKDEARVGQHGTLTRLWARRGSRPRIQRDRRFTWAYLFGAICPARGAGAAVVMSYVGVEAMNHHLIEISATVSPGAVALLIMDGAGWHRSNQLVVPDNIVLLKLPPYAPELNPTENIWQYLRANALANSVWETYEAIVEACCNAWRGLITKPEVVTSIGTRQWAQVNI